MTDQEMLQQILEHARQNPGTKGLFPASRYLTDISGCLSGGACPAQMMNLSTADEWTQTLKTASEQLTATDPTWRFDTKSLDDSTKGYILTAKGIMSTSNMDDDGDILDATGAEVEKNAPYLWHHMFVQPVGKVLETEIRKIEVGGKTVDAVLFKCGILDVGNGLGRDTALLIKMDALRNSHGFIPIKAKPIKDAGWHITKYRTHEISGVSVPANRDSVFSEFSSEKCRFQSDAVKTWIKGHYDQRDKVWVGWSPPEEVETKSMTPEPESFVVKATLDLDTSAAEEAIEAITKAVAEIKGKPCDGCEESNDIVGEEEILVKRTEWEEMKQQLASLEEKTPDTSSIEGEKSTHYVVVDPVLTSLGL